MTDRKSCSNIPQKDTTSILTREWGIGNNSYYLLYEGQMDKMTQEGDYHLQLAYMANGCLKLMKGGTLSME
ncbi:MAG: hypothetical protein R2822_16985 [Spirosomataceae bacterium]